MADDVAVSSAATYDVATDDVGSGKHAQLVKLAYSADGSRVHATVDADGVLVNLGANNDVTVTGTVAVTGVATSALQTTLNGHVDGIETLLTTISGATGDLAEVGGAAVSLGQKSMIASIPVVIADDQSVIAAIVSDGSSSIEILPTGADNTANTVNQLATAAFGYVFDGSTWDRAPGTAADGTLVNLGANNDVTVTGAVAVTDNAGSLTVDAPVGTPVFVRLSDGSAAITTLPVSLASVPSHAVTNAGTFAAQVTAISAGDNNIGNVDVVTLPTVSTSTDISLASGTSSAQLIAANASRKGMTLTNTDANTAYIYYGTTASATKFTVKIPTDHYWEMPSPVFTGRIDAIWAGDGSGSLIGSEL